jgi:hypothetical protein
MNRTLFFAICFAIVTVACNKGKTEVAPNATPAATTPTSSSTARYAARDSNGYSVFISIADANEMIESYVKSRSNNPNATFGPDVKSYTIDADALRAYLEDPNVKNIKVCFAHTQAYIDAGNSGIPAGYQSGAMTLVIVGYDASGNYIYHDNAVLDHVLPCPYSCAPGQAGNDLLQ